MTLYGLYDYEAKYTALYDLYDLVDTLFFKIFCDPSARDTYTLVNMSVRASSSIDIDSTVL